MKSLGGIGSTEYLNLKEILALSHWLHDLDQIT